MPVRRRLVLFVLLVAGVGCQSTRLGRCPGPDGNPPCANNPAGSLRTWHAAEATLPTVEELSGMAISPDQQRILVVGERTSPGGRLVELRWTGHGFSERARWSVPASATEIESVAWLDDGRVLLGTETQSGSTTDILLVGELSERPARWSPVTLDYVAVWGSGRRRGRGIEAACGAAGMALIGRESLADGPRGRRLQLAWASAAELGRGDASFAPVFVDTEVTDTRFGLSSLACVETDGVVRGWAILRDCDAGRLIVQFELPKQPAHRLAVSAENAVAACHDDRNAEAIGLVGDALFVLTDEATGQPGSYLYRSRGQAVVR